MAYSGAGGVVLITVIICSCLSIVEAQQFEERRCYLGNGNIGICKSMYECREVYLEAVSGNQYQRCGYKDFVEIVCCPYGSSNNAPVVWATTPPRKPTTPRAPTPLTRKPTTPRAPTSPPRRPSSQNRRPPTSSYYQRKHYIKCQEYSRELRKVIEAIPLVLDPTPIRFELSRCYSEGLPLIVGGENTTQGEFPHMAALGYNSENGGIVWACGGSLISERFILTAAHCIYTTIGRPEVVRLGEQNLYRDDDGAQPREYRVTKFHVHPNYHLQSHYHDIALIELSQDVPFSSDIHPACLYFEKSVPGNSATATGWGRVGYGDDKSDTLLKVNLQIIPSDECAKHYVKYQGSKLRNGITVNQLCAGNRKGGKDTCHGDSGGPLQVEMRSVKCMFGIIGVTSFGPSACGFSTPGVYTRISTYMDWIESIVWPDTTNYY